MKKNMLILSGIALSSIIICSCSDANDSASESTSESESTSVEENENTTIGTAFKDETVYAICDAKGNANNIIVEEFLKNDEGFGKVQDTTTLNNILNLKGDEYFTSSNGVGSWNANGNDIHYRGYTTKQLPVEMNISYTLDNAAIEPADLKGKSGNLEINVKFTNNQVNEDGYYVPFVALSGLVLDSKVAENISINHGKVIDGPSKSIIVGYALPGLTEDLGLEDASTFGIDDEFTISADVTNFSCQTILSLVDNSAIAEAINSVEFTPDASLTKLINVISSLDNGSSSIYQSYQALVEKENELKDGLNALDTGVSQLYAGMSQLNDGLNTINGNSQALTDGSTQVFNGLLAQANQTIASAGLTIPTLTIDNYASVLDATISQLSTQMSDENVTALVTSGVKDSVTETVRQGIVEQILAAQGLKNGAGEAMTYNQYLAAYELKTIDDTTKQTIDTMASQKLETSDVQALISQNTQGYMASEEGKALLNAKLAEAHGAIASLEGLKTSLNQYNQFYTGLKQYTAGVGSATNGSNTIYSNLDQLVDGVTELKTEVLTALEAVDGTLSAFTQEDLEKVQALIDTLKENAGLTDKVEKIVELASGYNNYAGIDEGSKGSVKFIYRTAAI